MEGRKASSKICTTLKKLNRTRLAQMYEPKMHSCGQNSVYLCASPQWRQGATCPWRKIEAVKFLTRDSTHTVLKPGTITRCSCQSPTNIPPISSDHLDLSNLHVWWMRPAPWVFHVWSRTTRCGGSSEWHLLWLLSVLFWENIRYFLIVGATFRLHRRKFRLWVLCWQEHGRTAEALWLWNVQVSLSDVTENFRICSSCS